MFLRERRRPGGAVVALVRVTAYPLHHTANVAGENETRTRTTPERALRKTRKKGSEKLLSWEEARPWSFRLTSLRQGYGGPAEALRAKAEGGSHMGLEGLLGRHAVFERVSHELGRGAETEHLHHLVFVRLHCPRG